MSFLPELWVPSLEVPRPCRGPEQPEVGDSRPVAGMGLGDPFQPDCAVML